MALASSQAQVIVLRELTNSHWRWASQYLIPKRSVHYRWRHHSLLGCWQFCWDFAWPWLRQFAQLSNSFRAT